LERSEVGKLAERVQGWLTDYEGALLYELARNCTGKGVIVEIGSWKGKSTIWLASGSKKGKKIKVYAVDPHTGSSEHRRAFGKIRTFEEFDRNLKEARVNDIVVPILATSAEAANVFKEPVELIFIDGSHEYEMAKLDFQSWFPKVVNGGIMAFHDSFRGTGPRRVVEESLCKSPNFRNLTFAGSIGFAEKVTSNSMGERFRNRFTVLLRGLYELGFYDVYESMTKFPLPRVIREIGKRLLRTLGR
jgi:predicted O-methyltransferase YrrM